MSEFNSHSQRLVVNFTSHALLRRDLAPHLKTLMGPWWFAQFDPASEVSQAAKRSLQVCYINFILQFYFKRFLFIVGVERERDETCDGIHVFITREYYIYTKSHTLFTVIYLF